MTILTTQLSSSFSTCPLGQRVMYDSETGAKIHIHSSSLSRDAESDELLDRALQAATQYNDSRNVISRTNLAYFGGETDVAGQVIFPSRMSQIIRSLESEEPAQSNEPDSSGHDQKKCKITNTTEALLSKNWQEVWNIVSEEWKIFKHAYQSGQIESPTLMDRVYDLGFDEVKALGLNYMATQAVSLMVESAMILALTGPVSEKVVFLMTGFHKFRKISTSNHLPTLALGTIIMASPNLMADVLFHDSIYTKLAKIGFSEGYSGTIVVPTSFILALSCAIVLQYGVFKSFHWGMRRFGCLSRS